jgi:hypothetical protein
MSFIWSQSPSLVQDQTKSLCLIHMERLEMKSPLPEQWISLYMEPVHVYQLRDLQGPRPYQTDVSLLPYLFQVFSASLARLSLTVCSQGFILFINVQSILCPLYLQTRLRTPRGKMSIEDSDWRVPGRQTN